MNPLLQELSKKLAERWAALFLGPGLIFVAVASVAAHQGFRHAVDVPFLHRHLAAITADRANRETAAILMIAAFAASAAVIAGMLVAAAGRIVERWWTPAEGRRPTWYARRMAGLTRRVHDRYGVDLAQCWPHLWTIAGGDARSDVQAVQGAYAAAARLAGWAVAYALLFPATGWWPAVVVAAGLAVMARSRSRAAVDTLVPLVESLVDLNLRALAERVGVACPDAFTPAVGAELTAVISPERPSAPTT